MSNFTSKLKYSLILIPLLFAGTGCGELFLDPYADLIGSGGGTSGGGGNNGGGGSGGTASEWVALSNGANTITQTNNGVDILLFYAPASKPQVDYGTPTLTASGTVTTAKGTASLVDEEPQPLNFETTPLEGVSPTVNDPHIDMRLLENELLKSGKKQLNDYPETSKIVIKREYIKGSTYQFYGLHGAKPDVKFSAKCVDISDEAYFFIQEGQESILTTKLMEEYKTGFKPIYTTITTKFGPSGDVDINGKIMIIFYDMAKMPGVIGYFYSGDLYNNVQSSDPKLDNRYSNEGDIFYMNTKYAPDSQITLATLSHEFQHITYFHSKYLKMNNGMNPENFINDAWLNEGLSMLSSYYTGYADVGSNNYNWIGNFLVNDYPSLSLTYWSSGSYGYSALFAHYLNDRFGEDMAKKLYESSFAGIAAVEHLMFVSSLGLGRDFNILFNEFAQTLYLSGTGLSKDEKFNFKTIDLSIYQGKSRKGLSYLYTIKTGANQPVTLKPYSLALINSSGSAGNVTIPTVDGLAGYAAILQKK